MAKLYIAKGSGQVENGPSFAINQLVTSFEKISSQLVSINPSLQALF